MFFFFDCLIDLDTFHLPVINPLCLHLHPTSFLPSWQALDYFCTLYDDEDDDDDDHDDNVVSQEKWARINYRWEHAAVNAFEEKMRILIVFFFFLTSAHLICMFHF